MADEMKVTLFYVFLDIGSESPEELQANIVLIR